MAKAAKNKNALKCVKRKRNEQRRAKNKKKELRGVNEQK
jgi:hypothetical protein